MPVLGRPLRVPVPSELSCPHTCNSTATSTILSAQHGSAAGARRYPCLTKNKRSILTAPLHQLPWPLSGGPVTQPTPHIHRVLHTHDVTFHARLSPAARPSPVASERGCMHDCWAGRTASILRSQYVRCKMEQSLAQPSRRGCDTDACACTGTQRLAGRGAPLSAVSRHYPCLTKLKRSILTATLHQLPFYC